MGFRDGSWVAVQLLFWEMLLLRIARSILVEFPSSFFSLRLVSVHVMHPYSSTDTIATWKKLHFILSDKFDFHMIDNLLIAVYAFASHILMPYIVIHRETVSLCHNSSVWLDASSWLYVSQIFYPRTIVILIRACDYKPKEFFMYIFLHMLSATGMYQFSP